jgi:hypothetical protein
MSTSLAAELELGPQLGSDFDLDLPKQRSLKAGETLLLSS